MKQKKYDIFISYRRKGGDATARLFYERLTAMGYRVSYDIETLRGGKFNTQLYSRIEECKDVVAIMSADSLELREKIEDDWFRLEIAHALKCEKNIVPVFLRDFKMPESGTLPDDIAELMNFQGVTSVDEHFDSVLKKLCRLLKSNPVNRLKKIISAVLFSMLLVLSGVFLCCFYEKIFPYPFTTAQKNEVNSWVGQMSLLGTAYNDYLAATDDLIGSAKNSVDAGARVAFDDAVPLFERRCKAARQKFDEASTAIKALLQEPDCMPTDVAGVPIFLSVVKIEFDEVNDLVQHLERIADPLRPCAKHDRYKYIDLKKKEFAIDAETFSYSVMGVFYKVSLSALEEFAKIAREWREIPHLGEMRDWISDEKGIQQKMETLCKDLELVVSELAAILGNETSDLAAEEAEFEKLMTSIGVSKEDADKMVEASRYLSNLMMDENVTADKIETYRQKLHEAKMPSEQADSMVKKLKESIALRSKLSNAKESLEDTLNRAKKKFAPRDTDDIGTLWGKTLRFLTLNMPDEAKEVLSAIRGRNDKTFTKQVCDALESFIMQRHKLPFKAGVMAIGFESPAMQHAIFGIGDVIVEQNGKPVSKFNDYRSVDGNKYTIYRYVDGAFQKDSATMPVKQPKVLLLDLSE